MFQFLASNTQVVILTFKEGVLAGAAHDLKLDVPGLEGGVSKDGLIQVKLAASSMVPRCAVKDGKEQSGALSVKDLKKIEDTMKKQVLDAKRYPTVEFKAKLSDLNADSLVGTLILKGKKGQIRLKLTPSNGDIVASGTIHQPDFGIKPYTAMLGALKIKADLGVEVTLKGAAQAINAFSNNVS